MSEGFDARLADLESRLAFQDDTIQALNDVIVAQQRQLDRLQLQLAALSSRQDELQGQIGGEDVDVPPPHY